MNDAPSPPTPTLRDALLRRPLAVAAGLFVVGITLHNHLPPSPILWLILAACLAFIALFPAPLCRNLCLGLSILLAGLTTAQLEAFYYPSHHISHFIAKTPRPACLRLRIDQPPRILKNAFDPRPLPPRQVSQATVLGILTHTGWQPATGTILLHINGPHPDLAIAQEIEAFGMLHRPFPAMNPGQFNWADYYREQRILASLQIPHAQNIRILSASPPGLLARLRIGARESLQRGFTSAQSLDHALLRALVLGDSDPQLRDVQDRFIATGTSHHLAISGAHIAVLGGFIYFICRLLRLLPRTAAWTGMAFVILYGLVALPSPPVVRSVLLCLAFGIGLVSRRSLDGIQLLSLSVFLMLIYHPLDFYNAGFQLSFGTVLGLMLFTRPSLAFIHSFRDQDLLIAAQVQKPPLLRRARWFIMDHSARVLVAGLVAWLVSAPLIAYHFSQLNPWAIPAGIVLAVPVLLALVAGLLKIILTLLVPPLAPLFAIVAAWPVAWMRHIVDWLATFPGSDLAFQPPPIWAVLLYYGLLLVPLLPARRKPIRWSLRATPAAACLIGLLLPLHGANALAPTLRLTLLSVGAGQCAVVQLPSGQTLLFDAGSSSSEIARNCVIPYLKHLGLRRIDSIFISHANYDHYSAVEDLTSHFNVSTLYLSPYFERQSAASLAARDMLRGFVAVGGTLRTLAADQHIALDAQTTLEVLWPTTNRALSTNDASLVLKLRCAGRSILITGDIQSPAERELLGRPEGLRADILIAPHHGSAEATTAAFIDAVSPTVILCSNDSTLTRKQRAFDRLTLDRAVLRSHLCGAITITIDRQGIVTRSTYLRGLARPRQD